MTAKSEFDKELAKHKRLAREHFKKLGIKNPFPKTTRYLSQTRKFSRESLKSN